MQKTTCYQFNFFRLTESTYQTAKVAKILLLLERGKGAEFKGKTLNEINVDNAFLEEEEEEVGQPSEYNTEIIDYENPRPGPSSKSKYDLSNY